MTDLERLMSRVEYDPNGGCWFFSGAASAYGHGAFALRGRVTGAHRASWLFHRGPIPAGAVVMHRCDVPACVNPAHLMLGTQADNLADMRAKGRGAPMPNVRGESCGKSKLTDEIVLRIRQSYADGTASQYELAAQYGVTQTAIWWILARRTWKHLPSPFTDRKSE